MIRPEDEYNKLQCPFIAGNSYKQCVGSSCVAWQWQNEKEQVYMRLSNGTDGFWHDRDHACASYGFTPDERRTRPPSGRCLLLPNHKD